MEDENLICINASSDISVIFMWHFVSGKRKKCCLITAFFLFRKLKHLKYVQVKPNLEKINILLLFESAQLFTWFYQLYDTFYIASRINFVKCFGKLRVVNTYVKSVLVNFLCHVWLMPQRCVANAVKSFPSTLGAGCCLSKVIIKIKSPPGWLLAKSEKKAESKERERDLGRKNACDKQASNCFYS